MNRSQSWLGLKVSREREPTTPLSAQFTALPLHQDEGAGPSTTWSSLKGVSTLEQRTEILGPGAFQGQNLPGEEVFGSSIASSRRAVVRFPSASCPRHAQWMEGALF